MDYLTQENLYKMVVFAIIIGAINWGVYGVFGVDLVYELGVYVDRKVAQAVYTLIGIAGVIMMWETYVKGNKLL